MYAELERASDVLNSVHVLCDIYNLMFVQIYEHAQEKRFYSFAVHLIAFTVHVSEVQPTIQSLEHLMVVHTQRFKFLSCQI